MYRLEAVTTPVAVYYAVNDWLADLEVFNLDPVLRSRVATPAL
jgi:hypothetical protein